MPKSSPPIGRVDRRAGGTHARQLRHPVEHLRVELNLTRLVLGAIAAHGDVEREEVAGIDPGVDAGQGDQASHQQRRSHEQDQRDRNFGGHQHVAGPPGAPGTGTARSSFGQRVGQAAARELDGGHEPERDSDGERHRDREQEHPQIHGRAETRDLGGRQPQERSGCPFRQDQPGNRARGREDERFGQQLPDDPRPIGANRAPERQIASSRRAAAEEQARHVGAGDSQNERHRPGKHQQRALERPGELLTHRYESAASRVVLGMLAREAIANRGDLRARLRERHIRLEPGHGTQVTDVAVAGHVGVLVDGRTRYVARAARDPQLGTDVARSGARGDHRPREVARHDRQNMARTLVENDGPADEGGVRREMPAPQTFAQHHRRRIGSVRMERLAEQRTRPEHVEKGRRDARSVHPLRLTRAGHGERHVADASETAEAGGLRPEIDHPSGAERLDVAPWARVPEKDQPVGSGKRQWLDEGRVDDAEDRGIGPDP